MKKKGGGVAVVWGNIKIVSESWQLGKGSILGGKG